MSKHKVIISGGGTGGHIFPAIAIANALKKKSEDIDILFVGAIGRMEMEKVPEAGYKIVGLPIMGLQRKLTLKNLQFPVKLISSLIKARKILKEFQPDVAVGVGGYASGPLLRQAASMGIPGLIQEQNSYAGITNKLLARHASKICVAYEGMERFFPGDKIVLTGNPVRRDIIDLEGKRTYAIGSFNFNIERKTLLILGGSLGARTINESIIKMLPVFKKKNIQVIWQTGKAFFPTAKKAVDKTGYPHIKAMPFIDKMDMAYSASDIVISRAGAISVSELCIAGKPVILIPSPNVAEDHQTKNAMALVGKEAAIMVKDSDAVSQLGKVFNKLIGSEETMQKLKNNITEMARPNADVDIAEQVYQLMNNKA